MRVFSTPAVVAAAEVFLQPDVHADEEIAAPHFLDLQLGHAVLPVAPGDRDHGPGVAPDDGLERQLDRQVEMGRHEGAAALDHAPAVGLEGVRRVVQADVEHHPDEEVRQAVHEELQARVVHDVARRG